MEQLPILGPVDPGGNVSSKQENQGSNDQITEAVAECKQLARDYKKQFPSRSALPAGIHQSLPNRAVIDELVHIYFNTFESCYRIIHLPSFQAEYDNYVENPEMVGSSFVVKLLLVMSIAAPLHSDAKVQELSFKARAWIHISQTWLSAPLEKDRLTLDGIQIHCLLLLSRQVNRVGPDLVWVSAGALMRMAMQMGLHQDPNLLEEMSVLQKEIRRRLWFTVLEMNVQAALDSGMPPMINTGDYNTQPPSNLSDEDLLDTVQEQLPEIPASTPTQTSFQCLLAGSLPLRLEVSRVINSLQGEPSYDQVLHLGSKLTLSFHNTTSFIDHHVSVGEAHSPSNFAYSCYDHCLRRFLLCLHFPYAVKAKQNPLYSYSLKVCLESTLNLVSLFDDDVYHRLLLVGGGMFRDIITRGALVIYMELISQLEADGPTLTKKRNRARREPLLEDARKVVRYAHDRLLYGETNVKGYLYVSVAMAKAEALLDGSSVKDATINATSRSLAMCQNILKSMAVNPLSNGASQFDVGHRSYDDTVPIPSVIEADFDFLNDGGMDFDFSDSCFLQQWTDQAWL